MKPTCVGINRKESFGVPGRYLIRYLLVGVLISVGCLDLQDRFARRTVFLYNWIIYGKFAEGHVIVFVQNLDVNLKQQQI